MLHTVTLCASLSDCESDQEEMFVSQDSNSSQVHKGPQQQKKKHRHPYNGKIVWSQETNLAHENKL